MILYCGVGAHCQAGMVAVVNQNKPNTLKEYTKAATGVQMNVGPPNSKFALHFSYLAIRPLTNLEVTGGTFTQGTSGGPVIIASAAGAGPRKAAAGPCVGTSRRAVGRGSCVVRNQFAEDLEIFR